MARRDRPYDPAMCGRMTLARWDVHELAALLGADLLPEHAALFRPRYNLAPTQQGWIVRVVGGRRRLLPATWGLQGPRGPVINARAETAGRLPTFRPLVAGGRCVVPADGFFEWEGRRGAREPLWFHPGQGPLLMAGLHRDGPGGGFVVLTTAASGAVRPVHDRMPALLTAAEAGAWLERPDLSLLRPAPDDRLEAFRVSDRVNSAAVDDPSCVAPIPRLAPAQGSLALGGRPPPESDGRA